MCAHTQSKEIHTRKITPKVRRIELVVLPWIISSSEW